jgi:mannose-6-phosphate isomerase-like protein (cupin superfamily)
MATEAIPLATHAPAWCDALQTGMEAAAQVPHFPRYVLRPHFPGLDSGIQPLARGRNISLCALVLPPGDGAIELQAYDDDATWLALAGEATFRVAGRPDSRLAGYQGITLPSGSRYGYRNNGEGLAVLLRGAARAEPLPENEDFYVGSRTGATEGISWRRPLWTGVEQGAEATGRYSVRFPLRAENFPPWQPLVRTDHLALHASCLEPERGEVNLHAHDDEAVWLVLFGQVTFWGEEDNRELFTLHPHDGVLIPRDTPYRYQNTGNGSLVMLRFAGRAASPPPLYSS